MKDKLATLTKAGVVGLVVLGFAGIISYLAGENDSDIEKLLVIVFAVLVCVLVGAVIVIESKRDE